MFVGVYPNRDAAICVLDETGASNWTCADYDSYPTDSELNAAMLSDMLELIDGGPHHFGGVVAKVGSAPCVSELSLAGHSGVITEVSLLEAVSAGTWASVARPGPLQLLFIDGSACYAAYVDPAATVSCRPLTPWPNLLGTGGNGSQQAIASAAAVAPLLAPAQEVALSSTMPISGALCDALAEVFEGRSLLLPALTGGRLLALGGAVATSRLAGVGWRGMTSLAGPGFADLGSDSGWRPLTSEIRREAVGLLSGGEPVVIIDGRLEVSRYSLGSRVVASVRWAMPALRERLRLADGVPRPFGHIDDAASRAVSFLPAAAREARSFARCVRFRGEQSATGVLGGHLLGHCLAVPAAFPTLGPLNRTSDLLEFMDYVGSRLAISAESYLSATR